MPTKFSLDAAMYWVVVLLALGVPLSTAAASIAVGAGVLFIIIYFVRERKFPQFDKKILTVFAVYLICQLITALTSWDVPISLREVGGELHRFFPLLFAMTFIKNREQLSGVLIATILAALINDAAGIWQYVVQGEPRAYGLNHTPTFFGSFMLMQFPMMIFIAQSEILSPMWKKIAMFVAGLTLICLVLSMTRGAWLSFIVMVMIFIAMEERYRLAAAKTFACLAIIFVVVVMFSGKLQDRLSTLTNANFQSNTERVLMWKSALEIFSDYPVFGIGQKMFFKAYNEQYISPEAKERPGKDRRGHTHPHNNFLHRLSEGGLIGFASFIGLYLYFFVQFFKQWRREKKLPFSAGLTAFLILAALQLEGLTDTNMNQVPIMREFWLLAGTLIASEKILNR
ncbi:MAG: O-antigen ligase family protein [Selenomonadaceae bacterium]|nr:O-antigen ligase family protein [Selenomonadaceae bacterium]